MESKLEEQTPIQRLRQLLYWMKVPKETIQTLDLNWLCDNLDRYAKHPHYAEARLLIVSLLEANKQGKSKRLRHRK